MIKTSMVYALILLLFTGVASGPQADVLGTWNTSGNKSKIEIYDCANKICGKII